MLVEDKCIQTMIDVFEQHLRTEYRVTTDVSRLSWRLVNLVTLDQFPETALFAKKEASEVDRLSKVDTEWTCHQVRGWKVSMWKNIGRQPNSCCNSERKDVSDGSPNCCDCPLKSALDTDPYLRLGALTLKTFHCYSSVPLDRKSVV